ncbi:exopolyphosphatase [candidate division KSB1 bacterium]|nr:exopolyphosphatase [candidate division KSB1 bacterium]NIR70927.1 exopolyphosphatase [candidate division KSB1 bacterium]NIS24679.1 exopolyphosphatase [candidate division KSB1 bacterium]NIT71581.1 exopolyphosphatase [candidate division KSB1 bacterium]NIU25279.1 exopolyphosphatase [candidate division KSB1 bacterium]
MKFAAIDIGSNAVRLLFKQVFEDGDGLIFKKDALFRVPIRLGEDVFSKQEVSADKAKRLVEVMTAFKHLIAAYQPTDYMACATSAMREASNGSQLVDEIRKRTDINLEIVDGKREAEIIYCNRIADMLSKKKSYLYIDVGGGSTEITLIAKNDIVTSHSFNLGTVRILNHLVSKSEWQELKQWLKQHTKDYQPLAGIGSGGNINKMFDLSRKKRGKPLTYKKIKKIHNYVNSYSFEDRIKVLRLKPDRADVIIPASKIFVSVMKWAKIKRIYVPQIGLSDGIIHVLYDRYKQGNSKNEVSVAAN